MESARIISLNRKKRHGLAEVVVFARNEYKIINTGEEILFHFGCGYKIKEGKNKPRFNYKQRLKKLLKVGEYIVFVREKSENKNLMDKAAVWGLRTQYKETWRIIDRLTRQAKKNKKIERLFQIIETEQNISQTRKAL